MTSSQLPEPPEPEYGGDERTTLTGFLDFYRSILVRKGAGLDAERLTSRLGASSLTIGRLIRHMTQVEDHWFQRVLPGDDPIEPWASAPWGDDPDWEMTTADGLDFATLRSDFEAACARSRATLERFDDLDLVALGASPDRPVSIRWILVHMIEEYARHCGHADLIRESIDGDTVTDW